MSLETNRELAKAFQTLRQYFEQEPNGTFRAKAYANAVVKLRTHPTPITSGKQAMKIKGIGKSIAEKID